MSRPSNRRALQITLGVTAAIPFVSGLAGIIAGPAALPGAGEVSATVDSEYRFISAYWLAVAPIAWASLPAIDRRTAIVQTIGGVTVAGGLARLLSLRAKGRPHPMMLAALGIELGMVPALMGGRPRWPARPARTGSRTTDRPYAQVSGGCVIRWRHAVRNVAGDLPGRPGE